MVIGIILVAAAILATAALLVVFCYIRHKRRIREIQEKVYNEFMYEQAVLQQNYFAAYSALLRVAEEQEKKAQNPARSRW